MSMANAQGERHFMWLVAIVAAAMVIAIELTIQPISLFKLGVCAAALLVIGVAFFMRARNRRLDRT
jgi:hypothetical protein